MSSEIKKQVCWGGLMSPGTKLRVDRPGLNPRVIREVLRVNASYRYDYGGRYDSSSYEVADDRGGTVFVGSSDCYSLRLLTDWEIGVLARELLNAKVRLGLLRTKKYPISSIILVGSYAAGIATFESDVDLLVVGDFPWAYRQALLKDLYGSPRLDVIWVTKQLWGNLQEEADIVGRLQRGPQVVIFGKGEIVEEGEKSCAIDCGFLRGLSSR